MKLKLRRGLTLGAASLLLLGSFFLPNAVAGIVDSGRFDNLIMIDSQSISFDSEAELGLPGRIALIASSGSEIMPLNSGNAMDEETAGAVAIREFTRLLLGGPFDFDFRTCRVEECTSAFVIDTVDPNFNMIVWELTLSDAPDNKAILTIDDETGMILKIIFRMATGNQNTTAENNASRQGLTDEELHKNAFSLAELMREYYDLPIILGDYHFNGSYSYYRADLPDGGRVIPMFGVVRSTGFTTNERITRAAAQSS